MSGRESQPNPGESRTEEVRRRTDEALSAIGHGGEGHDDEARRQEILETRARRLARPEPVPRGGRGESVELVRFLTDAGEEYALEARWILEVFRPGPVTRLPAARAPAIALTSWRGEIVPVLDLGQILGQSPRTFPRQTMALVLGTDRPGFIILAAQVPGAENRLRGSLVQPASGTVPVPGLLVGVDPEGRAVLNGEQLLRRYG